MRPRASGCSDGEAPKSYTSPTSSAAARSAAGVAVRRTWPTSSPSAGRRNWLWRTRATRTTRVRALRDKLESSILSSIPGTTRNGAKEPRLPNTSNVAFDGVEAEGILMLLDEAGICASSGSGLHEGGAESVARVGGNGLRRRPRAEQHPLSVWASTTPRPKWITC